MVIIRLCVLVFVILFIPIKSFAAVASWEIDPKESSLLFTGKLNDAPTSGQFKSFTGTINFEPDKLNESSVSIIVDTGSVWTSFSDIANTLKMPDWFDVKLFPQATFKSHHFTQTGDKTYQANGELTIRDKSIPVIFTFKEVEYTQEKINLTGNTSVKRSAFDVGRGEWADTDSVKDEVVISFTLTARRI